MSSDNGNQVMFGAMNCRPGPTHFALRTHRASADFEPVVDRDIMCTYPEAGVLFLIVDGASVYNCLGTRAWLTEPPQVGAVPLPTMPASQPPRDHVWRWLPPKLMDHHPLRSLVL